MTTVQQSRAYEVKEGGLTELVGINEQLTQNQFSAAVGVDIDTADAGISGEVVQAVLVSSGTGLLKVEGDLLILDADPANAADSATLDLAEHQTLIGRINFGSSDWTTGDANAVTAHKQVAVPFHQLKTLYFVFQLTSATQVNSLAGDDELIQLNFWFRQEK